MHLSKFTLETLGNGFSSRLSPQLDRGIAKAWHCVPVMPTEGWFVADEISSFFCAFIPWNFQCFLVQIYLRIYIEVCGFTWFYIRGQFDATELPGSNQLHWKVEPPA